MTFNGVRQITVDPWSTPTSDPLGLELAAGDLFCLRLFSNTPASGSFPKGTIVYGSIAYALTTGGYGTGDAVDSTSALATIGINPPSPLTIMGRPLLPAGTQYVGILAWGTPSPRGAATPTTGSHHTSTAPGPGSLAGSSGG